MIEYFDYIQGFYADVIIEIEIPWNETEIADQLYAELRGWA